VVILVDDTLHAIIAAVTVLVAEATPSTVCTSAWTLVVSRKRITSSEAATTLGAGVWTFAGVQFGMAFEVVQAAKLCLACRTFIWFLLTVRE